MFKHFKESYHQKNLTYRLEQIDKNSRKARIESIVIIIVILLLIAVLSFSNEYITVVPSDGTIYLVQTKWWGLSKNYMEIIWTQADGYDYPARMTHSKDGSLYPVISEDFDARDPL